MPEAPRYRCASETGSLPHQVEIVFAKLDYRAGVGTRVEQGDEFSYEGQPGKWMEPVNEAAQERVAALVKSGGRKQVGAETSAPTIPLKAPPRSGMTRAITDASAFTPVRDVRTDENPKSSLSDRPAPRRRATTKVS